MVVPVHLAILGAHRMYASLRIPSVDDDTDGRTDGYFRFDFHFFRGELGWGSDGVSIQPWSLAVTSLASRTRALRCELPSSNGYR